MCPSVPPVPWNASPIRRRFDGGCLVSPTGRSPWACSSPTDSSICTPSKRTDKFLTADACWRLIDVCCDKSFVCAGTSSGSRPLALCNDVTMQLGRPPSAWRSDPAPPPTDNGGGNTDTVVVSWPPASPVVWPASVSSTPRSTVQKAEHFRSVTGHKCGQAVLHARDTPMPPKRNSVASGTATDTPSCSPELDPPNESLTPSSSCDMSRTESLVC